MQTPRIPIPLPSDNSHNPVHRGITDAFENPKSPNPFHPDHLLFPFWSLGNELGRFLLGDIKGRAVNYEKCLSCERHDLVLVPEPFLCLPCVLRLVQLSLLHIDDFLHALEDLSPNAAASPSAAQETP